MERNKKGEKNQREINIHVNNEMENVKARKAFCKHQLMIKANQQLMDLLPPSS